MEVKPWNPQDGLPRPVKPSPPEQSKPRGSWLAVALAVMVAGVVAAVLTVLTLGYFGPVLIIGLAIFSVIGLQYLVWGWWMERAFRDELRDDDRP